VREIVGGGHEIGTHGYAHQLVYRQTPEEFRTDLARSLSAIRAAAGDGATILGYRAPSFSVIHESRWALAIVRDHGLRYDSSILPMAEGGGSLAGLLRSGKRYGIRDASRFAAPLAEGLWEFPVSTVRLGGRTLQVGGGGFFRLFPLWFTRRALRKINAEGQPAVVYLHPWEFDTDQPPVPDAPALARLRHGLNVHRTASRLATLLREMRFGPLRDAFASQLAQV
jgi:polysaccharide deacetylase family protein (PEP-CTERM system associated)